MEDNVITCAFDKHYLYIYHDMVFSWIINSLSKDIAGSEIYSDWAHDVWMDLKVQYIQRNGPRYLELKKVLACHTQGSLTVGEYFIMLKCLWEELVSYRILSACPCGAMLKVHDIFQEEYVLEFLMGLNESYSNVEGKFFCLNLCHQLSRFSY